MHYYVRHYWKYPMPLLEIPHAILRDHERVHRHELISSTNTFVLMGATTIQMFIGMLTFVGKQD